MKKVFNILAGVALMASVVACDVEYDPIVIIPNPELNKTGLQAVNTISIYDEQETVINIARTAGLSKEMNMNVLVDEALIDEYNLQNGTSFEVLPSQYYTFPEEVLLEKDSLDVDFSVVIKPSAITNGLGLEESANYILPLRIESPETGIDSKQDVITVLLRPVIATPKVSVNVPTSAESLEFVSVIPLTQDVELNAVANFNTLEVSKVEYQAMGQSEVDAYNEANGTDYKLLTQYYTINDDVFNAEDMSVKTTITFDCSKLGNTEEKFMLPVKMISTAYDVIQTKSIYIAIEMSSLNVWVSSEVVEDTTGNVKVQVEINTPMLDEQPLYLTVNNDLVAAYNTANGTSYGTLDASKVTITPSAIAVGDKKGSVSVAIDMNGIPYDAEKFLLPLTVVEDELVEGSVLLAENTTYVVVYNSILGVYENDKEWRSEWNAGTGFKGAMSNYGDNLYFIRLSADCASKTPKDNQKYGSKYSYNMVAFFDVDFSKEIDPTFYAGATEFKEQAGSGCYPIINVIDREDGYDAIPANFSYINTKTGEVYFDFTVLGWWGPGGGGGAPLPDGCTKPGDWFCARFYNRVME